MKQEKDIRDDEIRIIGGGDKGQKPMGWKWLLLLVLGIIIGIVIWQVLPRHAEPLNIEPEEEFKSEQVNTVQGHATNKLSFKLPLSRAQETGRGFIEIADTTINDIPMKIYIPHQMSFSLYVGAIDRKDPTILFTAQAADVRADNGGIVGAFVLEGEPLAWGGSKRGFCAVINDTVIVGVADNSPYFEEATEKGGYFFRQFPLVENGQLVENEIKGKSIRRALCDRGGEIFTVETLTIESFHDFSQALADLGVDQAISLVGANSYGWATDAEGQRHEFGNPTPPKKKWKNVSYLVMKERPLLP